MRDLRFGLSRQNTSVRFLGAALCMAVTTFASGQRPKAADFEFIGVEHNKMLEYAYNEIVNNGIDSHNPQKFGNTLAMAYASQYASYYGVQVGVMSIRKAFASRPKDLGPIIYSPEDGEKMSEILRRYMDQLSSIITNNTDGFAIKAATQALEISAQNDRNLRDIDCGIFFSTTSVAKHSAEYWAQNLGKWKNLPNTHGGTLKMNRYIRADVEAAGAVAGAAWWENGIPGVGTALYGGEIIGGGLGASAACMLYDLIFG